MEVPINGSGDAGDGSVLRAIEVPKGEHTIELRCEPDALKTFNIINLIGSILIAIFVIGAIALPFIKKRK